MPQRDTIALLRAVVREWKAGATSSAFLLLLGMVERAFGTHHDLIYLLVAGPLFFAVACAKAWLKENAARTRLEAMLSPWLSLELEPGKPYVETHDPYEPFSVARSLRFAVRNGSAVPAEVRVAIESGSPDSAVHLNHFLQAMGRPLGEERQTIAPGRTGFFDLIEEVPIGPAAPPNLQICYAQRGVSNVLTGVGPWSLGLRLEGDGSPTNRIIIVRRDESGHASLHLGG